jgi:hypothetical protein
LEKDCGTKQREEILVHPLEEEKGWPEPERERCQMVKIGGWYYDTAVLKNMFMCEKGCLMNGEMLKRRRSTMKRKKHAVDDE